MDHKKFFEKFEHTCVAGSLEGDFDVEDLYQAIKARLIEDLRTESANGMHFHLIDTTGDANGR